MAVTDTDTNNQLCTDALRKIGVVAHDTSATSDEIDIAKRQLSRMLKAWQTKGYSQFTTASQSVTLTTAASYTMSPVRPLDVLSCNYKNTSGIETPMIRLTRDEYDALPDKTTTGTPTQFYYDRQRESALIYVWPLLSSATTESLEITYTREIEDVVLAEAADVPGEWYDAVVYNLAARLLADFMVNDPQTVLLIKGEAKELLDDALAHGREGSVFFNADG